MEVRAWLLFVCSLLDVFNRISTSQGLGSDELIFAKAEVPTQAMHGE
jgi:hypothetical protein